MKAKTKKLPELDKIKALHSVASETDTRVWWYEELEAEILAMMKYCVQKAKVLKGDPKAKAHLVRVGKSIDNLKISSSLSMGNLEDLYKMRKPKDQPK